MAKPFYGVDGNLLVEDLPYNHDDVEAILNGTTAPAPAGAIMRPGNAELPMLRHRHG